MLARAFHASGDDVVVLSRAPSSAPWRVAVWDARTFGAWTRELEGADAVINLAGRNVNCRYTPANRDAIMRSRVDSARVVGQAMSSCVRPPSVLLQASTATIYAHRFDAANDEATGIIGGSEPDAPASWRFSIEVAQAWEAAATESVGRSTRLVLLRSAMIMSPDRGGIFDTLLRLVRLGLGGSAAGGRQYVSWVHEHDFVRGIRWLIARRDVDGAVNIAAPNPLPYADFMRNLRRAAHVPISLPATKWMLSVGAWAMRSETELVLKSRRVVPARLVSDGFRFEYPEWRAAAEELVSRGRKT